jgi:hypothetical protein
MLEAIKPVGGPDTVSVFMVKENVNALFVC